MILIDKMQSWTLNNIFLRERVVLFDEMTFRLLTKSGSFLEGEGAYEGWSFCRAEMSRGGGARPLHSLSCPSLKRRLRAGRGTPDSAGG